MQRSTQTGCRSSHQAGSPKHQAGILGSTKSDREYNTGSEESDQQGFFSFISKTFLCRRFRTLQTSLHTPVPKEKSTETNLSSRCRTSFLRYFKGGSSQSTTDTVSSTPLRITPRICVGTARQPYKRAILYVTVHTISRGSCLLYRRGTICRSVCSK